MTLAATTTLTAMVASLLAAALTSFPTERPFEQATPRIGSLIQISSAASAAPVPHPDAGLLIGNGADGVPPYLENR